MNREIKLRYLITGGNKIPVMCTFILYDLVMGAMSDHLKKNRDIKFCGQYTNNDDRDSEEIYDNDILLFVEELEGEYRCGQSRIYLRVTWENDGWYLTSDDGKIGGKFEEFDDLEKVGNMYQNSELMKQSVIPD